MYVINNESAFGYSLIILIFDVNAVFVKLKGVLCSCDYFSLRRDCLIEECYEGSVYVKFKNEVAPKAK